MTKTDNTKNFRFTVEEVTNNLNNGISAHKESTFSLIAAITLMHEGLTAQDAQTICREFMLAHYPPSAKGNATSATQLGTTQSDWIRVARAFHKTEEAQEAIKNAVAIEAAQELLTAMLCDYGTFKALKEAMCQPASASKRASAPANADKLAQRALDILMKLMLTEPGEEVTPALDSFFRTLESEELKERKQAHASWQRKRMVAQAEAAKAEAVEQVKVA